MGSDSPANAGTKYADNPFGLVRDFPRILARRRELERHELLMARSGSIRICENKIEETTRAIVRRMPKVKARSYAQVCRTDRHQSR